MKILFILMLGGALSLLGLFALSGELSGASVTFAFMVAGLGAFGGAAIWIKAVGLRDIADEDNSRIINGDEQL